MVDADGFAISNVRKTFGKEPALRGVDLVFPPGRITVILGPSGCGKTTLLRILAGLERADAGTVRLDGRVVSDPTIRVPVERRGVGMVFQDAMLWPHLTVRHNISFVLGAGRGGDPRVLRAARAASVEEFLERHPGELSGGERRRAAIARAIVGEPRLFLLDEPLSGLDANLRVRLLATIRAVQRELGLTTVYVTHDQEEALGLADRVVVMRGGRVLQTGSPREVYERPATAFVAGFVGLGSVLPGEVSGERGRTVLGDHRASGVPEGPARFVVRPEQVRVVAEGGVSGNVAERLYQGDRWLLTVRVLEQDVLVWSATSREPGAEVRVELADDPVFVLRDEEDS